jgi:hypothetical protein
MVNVNDVADKLERWLRNCTISKRDATNEVNGILCAAGVSASDKPRIKAALDARLGASASDATATGACYYREAGALKCEAGLTKDQCDEKHGTLKDLPCMPTTALEAMEEQDLITRLV